MVGVWCVFPLIHVVNSYLYKGKQENTTSYPVPVIGIKNWRIFTYVCFYSNENVKIV